MEALTLRLSPGADLRTALESAVATRPRHAVVLVSGIGNLSKARLELVIRREDSNDAIVLHRTSAFLDGAVGWRVDVDGRKAAVLRSGGYAVVQVPAGSHALELRVDGHLSGFSTWSIALPVEVAANSRVFVRASIELTGVIPIPPFVVGRARKLAVVSTETAMPELRELKLSE